MLQIVSEKSGLIQLLPGLEIGSNSGLEMKNAVLENPEVTIRLREMAGHSFFALTGSLRFATADRIIFSNPGLPYVLLFVSGQSLQLQLPGEIKRAVHDRGAQLLYIAGGSFKIQFYKNRDYRLVIFFYSLECMLEPERQIAGYWPGQLSRPAALYFPRTLIAGRRTRATLARITQDEVTAAADYARLAGSILFDFINAENGPFQPAHLTAALLETFYTERDRLLAVATRTFSFSRLLTMAGVRDRSLFRKRMNQVYGMNIRDFITETRMAKAADLLADPGLAIKQIAGLTGFKNPFYFSRVFSQYFGQSPKLFRSKLNG